MEDLKAYPAPERECVWCDEYFAPSKAHRLDTVCDECVSNKQKPQQLMTEEAALLLEEEDICLQCSIVLTEDNDAHWHGWGDADTGGDAICLTCMIEVEKQRRAEEAEEERRRPEEDPDDPQPPA